MNTPQPNLDLDRFIADLNAANASRPNPLQRERPASDEVTIADIIEQRIREARNEDHTHDHTPAEPR